MRRRSLALPLLAVAVASLAGCSSGGGSPPVGTSDARNFPRPDQIDHSIHLMRAIGPIALGETRSAIESQLGPGKPNAIDKSFVVWPARGGELAVTFDERERVTEIRNNSSAFSYRGLSIASGLKRLRKALPSWKLVKCGPMRGLVRNGGPDGPGAVFAFYTGPPIPYTQKVGFPALVLSTYRAPLGCIG